MATIRELSKLAALGGLQASYVADTAGADNHLRGLRALTEAGEEGGVIDDYYANLANARKIYNKRKRHGAANFAENRTARMLNLLDPTQLITDNPDATLTGALMITGKGDPEKRKRVLAKYRDVIRKYQAKLDPEGPITNRQTSYHRMLQAQLADLDTDIAGHKQQRKENSLNYWLNPFNRAGPTRELGNRMARRHVAGTASPDSRTGRAFRALSDGPTLGAYNMIAGGEKAQQKLRRAAVQNDIYSEESRPEEKQAGFFYRDLDKPRSISSVGQEVEDATTGEVPFANDSGTGKFEQLFSELVRVKEPRWFTPDLRADTLYRGAIEALGHTEIGDPARRLWAMQQALRDSNSPQFAEGDNYSEEEMATVGDVFDVYSYDKDNNITSLDAGMARENALDLSDDQTLMAINMGRTSPRTDQEIYSPRLNPSIELRARAAEKEEKEKEKGSSKMKTASDVRELAKKAAQRGLWDNVHAKRKRGEKPAKKGDKDYPDAKSWKKTTKEAIDAVQKARNAASKVHHDNTWKHDMPNVRSQGPVLPGAGVDQLAGLKQLKSEARNLGRKIPPPHAWKAKRLPNLMRSLMGRELRGDPEFIHAGKKGSDQEALKAAVLEKIAKSPAWQRKAGKNSEGGLNAKGRASYNKSTGGNLKAPVTSKNPKGKAKGRKASFCARMSGMKKKNTSKATANDPDSRINKSLRKWNC